MSTSNLERQRQFYDTLPHEHLRPRADDAYAAKLVAALARRLGLGRQHRVLEIGAGFGRFSFQLLQHCHSLTALDLSPRALEELVQERDRRRIPAERCVTLCGDVAELADAPSERFDAVVGLFILHHLEDIPGIVTNLARLLKPDGTMGFVEPNRRNPLFLVQVMCCPDMHWREEKGMFTLSERPVHAAFRHAGLRPEPTKDFGFFPPQIYNASARARRLEARLEALRWLQPLLPFLLLSARRSS